jgi:hypothetical protein
MAAQDPRRKAFITPPNLPIVVKQTQTALSISRSSDDRVVRGLAQTVEKASVSEREIAALVDRSNVVDAALARSSLAINRIFRLNLSALLASARIIVQKNPQLTSQHVAWALLKEIAQNNSHGQFLVKMANRMLNAMERRKQ